MILATLLLAPALPQDDFWSLRAGVLQADQGDSREIDLWTARLGYGRFLREDTAAIGEFALTLADGDPRAELMLPDADTQALEAATFLRWYLARERAWNVFVEHGVGLALSSDPFPPRGTPLNLSHQAGVGLGVRLTDTSRLTLRLGQQHVSNGRGAGGDNPAWDGTGVFLGLELDRPGSTPSWDQGLLLAVEPTPWSALLEARAGEYGGDPGGGARAALQGRLAGSMHGQLALSGDEADGGTREGLDLALYHQAARGRLGVAYSQQDRGRRHRDEWALFGELDTSDLVTAAAVLGVQHGGRRRGGNRVMAGFTLRLYPMQDLLLESGFGARAGRGRLDGHDVELLVAAEYRVARRLSLFAERGYDGQQVLLGLRWWLGAGDESLRQLHRRGPVQVSRH